MAKSISSIGYTIPGNDNLSISFDSKKSLMDSDIILFSPTLPWYERNSSNSGYYQGKVCYGETGSFNLKEDIAHWKRELKNALSAGKTVVFLLDTKNDYFVDSGSRSYTGTGRNRQTTINVNYAHNYEMLPVKIGDIHSATGEGILPTGLPLFKTFFEYFKSNLEYRLYIQNIEKCTVVCTGKDKTKVLGAYFTEGEGHLVMLPYIYYDEEEFTEEKKDAKGKIEEYWTAKGLQFGKTLITELINIDKGLHGQQEVIPPPAWVEDKKYRSSKEQVIEDSIITKKKEIEKNQKEIDLLTSSLEEEQVLKNLLFAQGKPLENAVTKALQLLGYTAENYDDGQLELDQVITSPEGYRYIGECEGKDEKDIDISKFRQLSESMSADFSREEIKEKAFGILFGNAQRLMSPAERTLDFTQKCKTGAEREKIALIKTVDLFRVASYLRENKNTKFQKACRNAIHDNLGKIVTFPNTPVRNKSK